MTSPLWSPRFTLSPAITRGLAKIEMVRAIMATVIIPIDGYEVLLSRTRLRASHASSFIEGGRLSFEQAAAVIADEQAEISGMETDVADVRNYCKALLKAEEWAKMSLPLTETLIGRFHRLAMTGKPSRPTSLRKRKITVRTSPTADPVYLPPRPEDLPELIAVLEIWTEEARGSDLPAAVIAGLVHYQIAAIHPFSDGNNRTARLCADFILQRDGYGLNGLLSPEEQYAENLDNYYQALNVHAEKIDYYEGREKADLTPWLEYYIGSLAQSFDAALSEMAACIASTPTKKRQKRKKR